MWEEKEKEKEEKEEKKEEKKFLRADGRTNPKVVQEVLTELKSQCDILPF